METLLKHLSAMIAIDSGSWTLILLICGSAMWIIREHLSNIFMTVFCMPLMLSLSLIVNYTMTSTEFYATNKLSEWIIWTIVAGTVGALGGVGLMAATSRLADREPA